MRASAARIGWTLMLLCLGHGLASAQPITNRLATPQPTITLLSPSSGAVASAVTITGANFGASQGSGTVTFNGTSATVVSWADTSLSVTVPSTTTGLVIVTQNGASGGVTFTVTSGGTNPIAAARLPLGDTTVPNTAWAAAGVVGGIPSGSWTQCGATMASSSTAAQINTRIQSCTANQYVLLGAGTFSLTTGLVMKANTVVRGAGANSTFLVFSGNDSCIGANAVVCFAGGDSSNYFGDAKMQPGGTNAALWTSGYAQGSTQIVLSSIGSNGIAVGQWIHLDQAMDTATNSGFFSCETGTCSAEGGAADPGRVVSGIARQQVQIVKVTACSPSCTSGSTFTISPGVYGPNIASGYAPGAWWSSASIDNAGVENLSADATSAAGQVNIAGFNAHNIWVSGVRLIRSCVCNRSMVQMHASSHWTIQNSYIYGTSGQSQNYGVESYITNDALVVNNIFQHVVTPIMTHANQGSVFAYNYIINDTYDDGGSPQYHYMANGWAGHSGGVMMNLIEGNIGVGLGGDIIHGNPLMNTVARNYWLGTDAGRIDATNAIGIEAYNRYWNMVGNVLGTPGYHTAYASGGDLSVYDLGAGRTAVPSDALVATTMLRWGNWDVVSNATRWCGTASNTGWVATCGSASEVPTGVPTYPNSVPTTETVPNSFFLAAAPSWWPGGLAWPPIGPDVTGGSLASLGGHVYSIPARTCYLSVMGGPTDGSGTVLAFDPSTCNGFH